MAFGGLRLLWALQGAQRFFRACSASGNVIICGFPYKRIDRGNGHVRPCCRNAAFIVVLRLRVQKSITRSVIRTIEVVRRILE
jgi:hypothetical protein